MTVQIFGAIDKKGAVSIEGSGDWTCEKKGVGVYEIKFQNPFSSTPVVVASGYIPIIQGGSAGDNTFPVGPITKEGVTIRTFDVKSKDVDNAGKPEDSPFTLIAMGK
jgi:hypothetical protein